MRKLAVICIALIGIVLLAGGIGCSKAKPSISTTSLPNGEVNVAYSQTIEASGGSGTYSSWSITSGNLPFGLALNSSVGLINGTPTTAGTFNFIVQVTDSSSSTGSENLSITIGGAPTITSTSFPNGEVNISYSQALEASGGSGTYSSWSITAGNLPFGLALNSSVGVISGTPTTAGTFNFIAQVTDSHGSTGSKNLSITIAAAPTITSTSPLPIGEVNISYSQALAASGGSGTYSSWSMTSGALPAGLALNPSTGVINGTPTTASNSSFTVQITDSLGGTATKALLITIAAAPTITSTSPLPWGLVNTSYSPYTLEASGGSGTYSSWSITAGNLPPGLALNPSTGVISGTPTVPSFAGYSFTIQVTDSLGGTGSKNLVIIILSVT